MQKNWMNRNKEGKSLSFLLPEVFERAIAESPFHIKPNTEQVLRIIEKDDSCSCEWVGISINNLPSTFCFSIDHKDKVGGYDFVFPFFNTDKTTNISGLRSKNDAIIICQIEQQIHVFLIELKSENKGKYLQQLELSKIFVNFVIDRFNLVNQSCQIKKEDITFKGILFRCRKRSGKGTTRKKDKAEFENRQASFLIAEEPCHDTYRLQYFLN